MAVPKRLIISIPVLTQVLLVTLCVAGGLLISAQWQTQPTRIVNPVEPYTSLTDTRDALQDEQTKLKAAIDQTSASIETRTKKLVDTKQVDAGLAQSTADAALTAGLTNVHGRGLIITLDDSKSGDATDQAIAHAADLRDLVSLLRAGGAEAISINDERLITTSAIDCIVNTILVNQSRLSNPFVVRAIGDAEALQKLVDDPKILMNLHQRIINQGVIFTVQPASVVDIPAYHGLTPGSAIIPASS